MQHSATFWFRKGGTGMLLRLTRVDRSCGEYAELHGAGRSWVDDAFLPDEMG